MSFEPTYTYLSEHLPGVAGQYKVHPDDFIVEEHPLYLPSGEGEHLYLWIEKVDVSAPFLQKQLRQHLGVDRQDIGMAGRKDRFARTRQWISLPARDIESPEALVGPLTDNIEVLEVSRHRNKLKMGHLKGNHFTLVIRHLPELSHETLIARVEAKFALLNQMGMPNYYGPQRFGHQGQTFELGVGLLKNESWAKKVVRKNKSLRQLAYNAVQSAHFNMYLMLRMQQNCWRRVLPGDVMQLRDSNSVFVVQPEDVEEVQARFDRAEVCWTGPMIGRQAIQAQFEALELEQRAADALAFDDALLSALRRQLPGQRRAGIIYPDAFVWSIDGLNEEKLLSEKVLTLKFFLPSGSYASILCEEFFCSTPESSDAIAI